MCIFWRRWAVASFGEDRKTFCLTNLNPQNLLSALRAIARATLLCFRNDEWCPALEWFCWEMCAAPGGTICSVSQPVCCLLSAAAVPCVAVVVGALIFGRCPGRPQVLLCFIFLIRCFAPRHFVLPGDGMVVPEEFHENGCFH